MRDVAVIGVGMTKIGKFPDRMLSGLGREAVIAALNRNFIPIRVDSDRDQQTALLYRVKGLPDTWFISESGEVIGHRPGYIATDQLMSLLNVVMTGAAAK